MTSGKKNQIEGLHCFFKSCLI